MAVTKLVVRRRVKRFHKVCAVFFLEPETRSLNAEDVVARGPRGPASWSLVADREALWHPGEA